MPQTGQTSMQTNGPWGGPNGRVGGQRFLQTPWGQQMATENPQASYLHYANAWGGGTDTAYGRWLQQQAQPTIANYNAELLEDPFLKFAKYMRQLGPESFQNQYAAMAPQARGEQPNLYQGPVRVIQR